MPGELVDMAGPVRAWISGGGRSNATLIGSDDLIACVDSLHAPSLASQVRTTSEEQFGRSPDLTVYTHFHGDHIIGAETIGSSLIVSHRNARSFLMTAGEAERACQAAGNADLADEILASNVLLPQAVFDETMQVHVGEAVMDLRYVGPAHTDSDIVCHLPESGVVITGDVVFSGVLPVLRDADVRGWIRALERLGDLDFERVVPGHGPVSDRSSISAMRELLAFVSSRTWDGLSRGNEVEKILADMSLPSPFDKWGRQERLEPMVRRISAQADATERNETT